MNIAVYPGSFDPITNGHLDIINRASKLYDKLIICIEANPNKQPMFTVTERMDMIAECTKHLNNIIIASDWGLLVNFAKRQEANVIIRGLRAVTDFEYELQMAHYNKVLAPEIETIFLTTSTEYSFISSSGVKEVAKFLGDITKFVPENVAKKVIEKIVLPK